MLAKLVFLRDLLLGGAPVLSCLLQPFGIDSCSIMCVPHWSKVMMAGFNNYYLKQETCIVTQYLP